MWELLSVRRRGSTSLKKEAPSRSDHRIGCREGRRSHDLVEGEDSYQLSSAGDVGRRRKALAMNSIVKPLLALLSGVAAASLGGCGSPIVSAFRYDLEVEVNGQRYHATSVAQETLHEKSKLDQM